MRESVESLRIRTSQAATALRGMVRRLVVAATKSSGLWQLLGFEGIENEKETFDAVEDFSHGVGFYARPKKDAKAEAVVVNVGGESGHPTIVGSRDLKTQPAIDEDETVMFNSQRVVKLKADGTLEAGFAPGASSGALDGVVHGSGIDPWSGMTYTALGNTSAVVKVKK